MEERNTTSGISRLRLPSYTAVRCAVRLMGGWKQMGSQGGDAAWEAAVPGTAGTLARDSGWEGEAQGTLPSWQA